MRFVSIIVSFFLFTTLYAEQDLFVGEKIGYQESNPKAPDTLHYLEVEKTEDTYILRGVMTFSNNDVYIWKGTGKAKDERLIFTYYPVTGAFAGEEKEGAYFMNENGEPMLSLDKTIYILVESQ